MSSRLRAAIFGFGIVAVFAAGLARSAQAQETEEPEALIKQGISLRRKGDDRRAQGYLKRAYDLAKTPRSAAQLGLVEQALGQFADSQIHLSEALATKDAWVQENRAQLEESRNFVRSKLAKVAITGAPGDATIAVGSDPPFALPRDGVVWLAPGANTVVMAAPGRKPVTKTVTAGPGESTSVAVELPADAPPTPPAAAASAGIGAAPGGPTPAPDRARRGARCGSLASESPPPGSRWQSPVSFCAGSPPRSWMRSRATPRPCVRTTRATTTGRRSSTPGSPFW
jgi:hypothetical protein